MFGFVYVLRQTNARLANLSSVADTLHLLKNVSPEVLLHPSRLSIGAVSLERFGVPS